MPTRPSSNTARAGRRNNLFGWCIVACFGIDMQWRQSLGWNELHFHFAPLSVVYSISWTVSEHILVAQFNANFGGNVGQFVGVIDGEGAPAGDIGDVGQHGRPQALLLSTGLGVENADRVD